MEAASERYYDTLRLTDRQRQAMVRKLAKPRHQSVTRDDRSDERLAYNTRPALVHMQHPGGSAMTYVVWPRDLSNTGMGFLHGSFCYDNTRLEIMLKKVDGGQVKVPARVVRCQLLKATVHEVGVQFDSPIQVHDFIDLGLTKPSHETNGSDTLPRLNGRLLVITHSEDDRQLIQFVSRGIGLKVNPVGTADEAEQALNEQDYDLMLIDAALPCDARHTASGLQQAHPNVPILAISANPDDADHNDWCEAGCAEVIIKPFEYRGFVEVLGRYLPRNHWADPDQDALTSELWSNPQMRPLILGYLERMESRLHDLRKQVMSGSNEALDLLRDMKGSAGGYGYPQITDAAENLLQLLADHEADENPAPQSQDVRAALNELESLAAAACRAHRKSA